MTENQWISKHQEADLPKFKSHEEASSYFEKKYGERFVFEESFDIGNGMCSFYRLITDVEAYIKGITDLNSHGSVGLKFKNSYQPIRIMEDGSVHIDH